MDSIIKISELYFGYKNKKIFNNFKLDIKLNTWTTIVGNNGGGKSTLVKLILGLIKPKNGVISINNKIVGIDNLINIREDIGVVFENSQNYFIFETVLDNLVFPLENLGYSKSEIDNRIDEVVKEFGLQKIIKRNIAELNTYERELVLFVIAIIHSPKILILDEAFSMMNSSEKENLLLKIKEYQKKGLTVVQITHDLEDVLCSDRLIILNHGSIVVDGPTIDVLKEEKIITKLKLKLPFMVELSSKLKDYNLIDDIIFDMDELVVKIWG